MPLAEPFAPALETRTVSYRFVVQMLVIFTVLTALMNYPQVLHLRDGIHDEGDPLLNTWALAWIAHQIVRAPARLFDGNIFAPERWTLAFSETLLAPGLAAAPLSWLGMGPVLVHNLVFLSGFVGSGVSMAILVRELTGEVGPAILAGFAFAFLPFRFDHYAQLQLQQTQCLALVFWALRRVRERGAVRDGVLLGLCAAAQILSCTYYGVFLVPYALVVGGILWLLGWTLTRRHLVALAIAACVLLVATLPVARAYWHARQLVGERGSGEAVLGSATLTSYLAPQAGSIYGPLLERFAAPERRLFPGFTLVALATIGIASGLRRQRWRSDVIAYSVGLALAIELSLGFNGRLYPWLYQHATLFHAVRIPARTGLFTGFSLAVLAGFGAAALAEHVKHTNGRRALLVALGLLMLVECWSPVEVQVLPPSPVRAYADLLRDKDDSPTATVFEFPISSADDPTYMYYSTLHWQRLVNGYSGFLPQPYVETLWAMGNFPDAASMAAIRRTQARYLVIHGERLLGARYETLIPVLDARSDLTLVSRSPSERTGQHGEISVYRVSLDPMGSQ